MHVVQADWSFEGVHAFTTTRLGGASETPYDSFNLAMHVGDDAHCVTKNRRLLVDKYQLPEEPLWLNQTHSTQVVCLDNQTAINVPSDACFTRNTKRVCAVMTADCLPILLLDSKRQWVGAIHAGWRGLADGIIEQFLETVQPTSPIAAWIGPAISQPCFEVQQDVVEYFTSIDSSYERFFIRHSEGYWGDLVGIAEDKLRQATVNVFKSNHCTYRENEFFSYRRDGTTGRMASLIWME